MKEQRIQGAGSRGPTRRMDHTSQVKPGGDTPRTADQAGPRPHAVQAHGRWTEYKHCYTLCYKYYIILTLYTCPPYSHLISVVSVEPRFQVQSYCDVLAMCWQWFGNIFLGDVLANASTCCSSVPLDGSQLLRHAFRVVQALNGENKTPAGQKCNKQRNNIYIYIYIYIYIKYR